MISLDYYSYIVTAHQQLTRNMNNLRHLGPRIIFNFLCPCTQTGTHHRLLQTRHSNNQPVLYFVLRTNVVGAAYSGILSSGGLLRSDWLLPNRVIAHYYKVALISTLLYSRFPSEIQ